MGREVTSHPIVRNADMIRSVAAVKQMNFEESIGIDEPIGPTTDSFRRICPRCKQEFLVAKLNSADRFCSICAPDEGRRIDCPICGKVKATGIVRGGSVEAKGGGLCLYCSKKLRRINKTRVMSNVRAGNPNYEEEELDVRASLARKRTEYYERAAAWARGPQRGEKHEPQGEGGGPDESKSEWTQRRNAALPAADESYVTGSGIKMTVDTSCDLRGAYYMMEASKKAVRK